MTAPNLEDLVRRVERLERLLTALAERAAGEESVRLVLLDAVEVQQSGASEDGLLSNTEACELLAMAPSTWRAFRKRWGIQPAKKVGRRPRYHRRHLEEAQRKAAARSRGG